jgi:ATP dependent DNA ligase domain
VVCGEDGVAIFDAMHRHGTVRAAILQAFDLLELNGEDLRPVMRGKRKARLARLVARAPPGIEFNAHNTDEDGATVFRHACGMGLEGIVSKRLSAPYRSDRDGRGDQAPLCSTRFLQLHPVVPPHVLHFRHVPFLTKVKFPSDGPRSSQAG